MPQSESISLWALTSGTGVAAERYLAAAEATVQLRDLVCGSSLGGRLEELRGRSVLVATNDQLAAALALLELDGIARRLVLCPPGLPVEHLSAIVTAASVEAVVSNWAPAEHRAFSVDRIVVPTTSVVPCDVERRASYETEWVLLTSGTTGLPKLVVHGLPGLVAPGKGANDSHGSVVWSTFYDIRRYGGLQIFLRAMAGGGSLVLSSWREATSDFLMRAGAHEVSHISGTPSHWRRALMTPQVHAIAPRYVRLSGEIADQAILDSLRAAYPMAAVSHAFASTEAGVAFAVNDGLAGFPANLVGAKGDVELKVENGSLRIRSARAAVCYLGAASPSLRDKDGFVDTGDIVELRGDRYYFAGRSDGTINVGGLKVHPEEVEAVINRHPMVRMSLVKGRKNPITGAIVVADVVLRSELDAIAGGSSEALKREIFAACQRTLPQHKVPAAIRFVSSLDLAGSGKLARVNA